jgi:signal peptide peptidase SppA
MHEILSTRAWALESNFFNSMAPLVLKRLENGQGIEALKTDPKQIAAGLAWDEETGLPVMQHAKGNAAVLTVSGTMSKQGTLCAYGTKQYINMLARANAATSIAGIVLVMDTPGGAVDGLPEFAEAIRASQKPVVAYVDGMMCSAGYWSGSQASYIIANQHNYATIGSIGTLCMLVDQSEYLKKEGLKVTILRADQSADKARLNSIEPASDEAIEALKAELNAITDDFIAAVEAGRAGKLKTGKENIFSGKTYSKEEALKLGMIDAIGTLEDAAQKVLSLAKKASQQAVTATTPASNPISANMNLISKLFGGEKSAELSEEQQAAVQEADAAAATLEATVAEQATQITALTEAKEAAEQQVQSLQAQLHEREATISAQAEQISRLEAQGDSTTAAVKDADTTAGAKPEVADPEAERYAALGRKRNENK